MFFVRGLSSHGKEIFVNPGQVLYIGPAGIFRRQKTALRLTHNVRLVVDQDIQTVRQRFEDYLEEIAIKDYREGADGNESDISGLTP
jgi:hypothetical protein